MATSGLGTPSGVRLNRGTQKGAPIANRGDAQKNLERGKKFQGVGEIFLPEETRWLIHP